jgi:DNA polymerase III epsilon subunit-like protein
MKYPNTYVAWDLETSGLNPEDAVILEIGAAIVENGEITDRKSWLLNYGMTISAETTSITGITKDLIDAEGRDPGTCLAELMEILTPDTPHLTHNGMRFDIPFLAHHLSKTFGKTVGEHRDLIAWLNRRAIDTAVFVKAQKLGMEWKWGETFPEFATRVMNTIAKGVKYNVAICCEELGIDKGDLVQHRALGDVELTHRIYQAIAWPVYRANGAVVSGEELAPGSIIKMP